MGKKKSPVTGSHQKKRTLSLKIHRTVTKLIWENCHFTYTTRVHRAAAEPCALGVLVHQQEVHWSASGTGYCYCSWVATCGCGGRIRQLGLQTHVSVTTGPRLHVVLFVFQVKLHGRDVGSSSNWRETLWRNSDIGF